MAIQNIGVVGAGTMGNGIAQVCALAGVGVVMVDISTEAVERGLKTVAGSLDRMVKKEKISEADKATALGRIKGSTAYADLAGADLVIEAATENEGLKLRILKEIDGIVPASTVIATNTSGAGE